MTALGVLSSVMLAFEGCEVPDAVRERLASGPAAGVTLFPHRNVSDPSQLRALTGALQAAASELLLVAADQEGGQLRAVAGATPFPGNMALGAIGDEALAERVAYATGLELRAVGINVDYAPVCDLATNPANPALGIRSFGDEPAAVARLAAATVTGLQAAGVAATAKHFPGKGDVGQDTHHSLGLSLGDRERFEHRELAPFRAAIEAGARLVMSGHFAVPALTGRSDLPATLAGSVMRDLLRDELGFDGLSITDALDMRALAQGAAQVVDIIAALRAGVDLLLCAPDLEAAERVEVGLRQAALRDLITAADTAPTASRLASLRGWLARFEQPDLSVVASPGHLALAREVAERAITRVRDDEGRLPLALGPDDVVAVFEPVPRDLTPADTSSTVEPALAEAIRVHHGRVDGYLYDAADASEIAALRERAAGYDLLVIGTASASLRPDQAALARALLGTGVPAVTIALRTPFDLAVLPAAATHVCTYGILRPSCDALAAALFGRIAFAGRLPAAIPGLYATGHGIPS